MAVLTQVNVMSDGIILAVPPQKGLRKNKYSEIILGKWSKQQMAWLLLDAQHSTVRDVDNAKGMEIAESSIFLPSKIVK